MDRSSKQIAKWIEGEGEKGVELPEKWGEDGRKIWIERLKKEVGERRQVLRKLRKEQQKALIRETREQMRKRLERPREKEIARLMGKSVEGTMAKSVRARALHKRHPSAVQVVLCREKWRTLEEEAEARVYYKGEGVVRVTVHKGREVK